MRKSSDMIVLRLVLLATLGLAGCSLAHEQVPSGPAGEADTAYTSLDLKACEVLKVWKESGGSELRCPGYQGVPLFISEGDGRFDVDVGVPNQQWTSTPPFNWLGETVEWRLHDGRVAAVIIRYTLADPLGYRGASQLAVIKRGTHASPGCLVAWVKPGATPDMNTAARRLADERVPGFECGTDEVIERG